MRDQEKDSGVIDTLEVLGTVKLHTTGFSKLVQSLPGYFQFDTVWIKCTIGRSLQQQMFELPSFHQEERQHQTVPGIWPQQMKYLQPS